MLYTGGVGGLHLIKIILTDAMITTCSSRLRFHLTGLAWIEHLMVVFVHVHGRLTRSLCIPCRRWQRSLKYPVLRLLCEPPLEGPGLLIIVKEPKGHLLTLALSRCKSKLRNDAELGYAFDNIRRRLSDDNAYTFILKDSVFTGAESAFVGGRLLLHHVLVHASTLSLFTVAGT